MTLLLNKAHFPVTVLGPGQRIGLWLQGCTIKCFGCISRDTWPADPRSAIEVSQIMEWVRGLPAERIDGVTISGGEPLDQPDALLELLVSLDAWRREQDHPIDVLCYSGRPWAEVSGFVDQLALLDAIIPEPFVNGLGSTVALRGSDNQRVVALTDLGRQRYSDDSLRGLEAQRGQLQVEVDDESIWFIGIPAQGDMGRMRAQAAAEGITIGRPSWLS